MQQIDLFTTAGESCKGWHGLLYDSEPIDYGDCVNIEQRCSRCGMKVGEVSWTREAWDAKQQKPARVK